MSIMLGIHTLELKPSVTVETFEQFGKDKIPSYVFTTPGYSAVVYKGVKGNRTDKYILIFHMEGEEARKRYFFSDEEREAFYKKNNEMYPDNPKIPETLRTLADGFFSNFTDYDCIASSAPYQVATDDLSPNFLRIHLLELQPNVSPEQFEAFCTEVWSKTAWVEGETCYVMRGIKGDRVDQYAFVITVEGQSAQARIMGSDEEYDEEWKRVFAKNPQNQPALDKFKSLATGFGVNYTHYIDVGASSK